VFLIGQHRGQDDLAASEPRAGRAAGVTSDQADEIRMPLTPRLLVIFGPPNGTRAIPDHEVDSHNALQARLARDYLIHRPATTFTAATITTWRTRPRARAARRPEPEQRLRKRKTAGREAVRTLSVIVRGFTRPSPRAHGHMRDRACQEDRYQAYMRSSGGI
jgi:hypothetical protein